MKLSESFRRALALYEHAASGLVDEIDGLFSVNTNIPGDAINMFGAATARTKHELSWASSFRSLVAEIPDGSDSLGRLLDKDAWQELLNMGDIENMPPRIEVQLPEGFPGWLEAEIGNVERKLGLLGKTSSIAGVAPREVLKSFFRVGLIDADDEQLARIEAVLATLDEPLGTSRTSEARECKKIMARMADLASSIPRTRDAGYLKTLRGELGRLERLDRGWPGTSNG
jgi:hypothetical protein